MARARSAPNDDLSPSALAQTRTDVSAALRGTDAGPSTDANAAHSAQPQSSQFDMRPPRAHIPTTSKPPIRHPSKQSISLRNSGADIMNITSPAAEYSAARDKKRTSVQHTLPVLRWFSTKRSDKAGSSSSSSPAISRPSTPSKNQPDTPAQSDPSTPSSALSALADAFTDDPHILDAHSTPHPEDVRMPSHPQAARLPTALHRPSYFSNLTR